MGAFHHVVVGLERGMPAAHLLLERARQLADANEIEALCACDHLFDHHEDFPVGAFANSEALDAAVRGEANGFLNEVCEPYGITRHGVLNGKPAQVMKSYAERGADLLVVGCHGRSGWRTLFGSTSNALVHGTPCDVLAVHLPDREPSPMPAYRNVLVALNLSEESIQVTEHARRVADACGAKLSACHAWHRRDRLSKDRDAEQFYDLATFTGIDEGDTYQLAGNTAAQIHRLAQRLSADLVVVGCHGKHGLELLTGSTANAVLHGATCDALLVRIA